MWRSTAALRPMQPTYLGATNMNTGEVEPSTWKGDHRVETQDLRTGQNMGTCAMGAVRTREQNVTTVTCECSLSTDAKRERRLANSRHSEDGNEMLEDLTEKERALEMLREKPTGREREDGASPSPGHLTAVPEEEQSGGTNQCFQCV